ADAMRITADQLKDFGLIDRLIEEPLGGAHRDTETMAAALKTALLAELKELRQLDADALLAARAEKVAAFGDFREAG
ncbi:MAG: acetyl-CoA carboxylase carboxyl transferase subunit alpha, partial [Pseudomonadota bacterium]